MISSQDVGRYIVEERDARPAGRPGECFYCKRKVGQRHGSKCVIPQKVVRVRWTIEYETTVPACFDSRLIEFHRNDSSWCADNGWRELRQAKKDGCLCGKSRFEVIEDLRVRQFPEARSA